LTWADAAGGGVLGLASFADCRDAFSIETAFRMIVIAVSLVAGLLLASVASPARVAPRR